MFATNTKAEKIQDTIEEEATFLSRLVTGIVSSSIANSFTAWKVGIVQFELAHGQ